MHQILLALALMQSAFQVPPAPPRLPEPPLSEQRERREQYARTLRAKCMSQSGIDIVLSFSEARQLAGPDRLKKGRDLQRELAEAAYSDPIQMDRLERAIIADADHQTSFQREFARDQVNILKRLNVADRAIYARSVTPMQPVTPLKRCDPR